MTDRNTEVLVIGAGPAGLTAAMYSARANYNTLVLKGKSKSAIGWAKHVENYPGVDSASGQELLSRMEKQATKFGAEIIDSEALDLALGYSPKMVNTRTGIITADTVIIATGKGSKKKTVKDEEKFVGKGVSYCATCDGALYRGRTVAVYGKSEEAIEDVLALNKVGCNVVHLSPVPEEQIESSSLAEVKDKGIEIIDRVKLTALTGEDNLKTIRYQRDDEGKHLESAALFIADQVPGVSFLKKAGLKFDEKDYLIVDKAKKTNYEGVYGAGDVTGGVQQVVTAAADGTIAAMNAMKWLKENK